MRIRAIRLAWFRGAADPVSLDPDLKSMVVYGENGAGKSSFVDAVEHVLNDGKIHHLAHEYSGRHQEKAVLNTHKPKDRKCELTFEFQDRSELKIEIKENGSWVRLGAEAVAMGTWDYRRTVLRQDEVSAFIHQTKGGKYSALLPLLGLHQLEVAAENLRQLAKAIEQGAKLKETRAVLKDAEAKRRASFGTERDETILDKVQGLHASLRGGVPTPEDPLSCCEEVATALVAQISRFSIDHKRHLALQDAAQQDLKGEVTAVRAGSAELAGAVEPLVAEKLEVLQATRAFADKLEPAAPVGCPACGRRMRADELQGHVREESQRLHQAISSFSVWKNALGNLCDSLTSLRSVLGKAEVKAWRDEVATGALGAGLACLDGLDIQALRTSCSEEQLKTIEDRLLPVIIAAASASKDAPPDVQQLSNEKQMVEAARAIFSARDLTSKTKKIEALISFTQSVEHGVREEIKLRSQTVVAEISADIQSMWRILHPDDSIEHVRLFVPTDGDKAIDIGLKFHGVDQDSPRLTLSEGYRNSLGLCIFLAMAKREAAKDRPVFLDDVAVSLDRNHRGMIVDLLVKEFNDRQVIVLTHDRGWYTELRQQLDGSGWVFGTLLPYETPEIGIRWSHKTTTFGDARAHLKDRPDSAGNDARKIMDVELALICERLRVSLPFLRAERNDKRMAHEFLERLIADGKKCFQKRAGGGFVSYPDPTTAFEVADRLLVSWANRGSHTFDVVRPEAAKLIDACEKALEHLKCPSCRKAIWFADAEGSEWLQCQCGEIRWRYGKA